MLEVSEANLAYICDGDGGGDIKVVKPEDHDVTADGHLLLPPVRQTHLHHLERVHSQQSGDEKSKELEIFPGKAPCPRSYQRPQ